MDIEKVRFEFRIAFPYCWVCGCMATDIHEMACGPARKKAYQEPASWLRLCRKCHVPWVQHWPIAKQLAYKAWFDPANYDRVLVNKLRGRDGDAVDPKEVAYWSRLLRSKLTLGSQGHY
jgi:hypothetical protein